MNNDIDKDEYLNLNTARSYLKNMTELEFYNITKQVCVDTRDKTLDIMYLHYLCAINKKLRLRVYLNKLKLKYDDFNSIINHHDIYEFWFGTPLHTALQWNNDVDLVKLLINQGSDPEINDYYGNNPFQSFDNYYVNPFGRIFNTNQGYLGLRHQRDFSDVLNYYQTEINR